MTGGLSYLVGQVAALLVGAAALGALTAYLVLRARRAPEQPATAPAVPAREPVPPPAADPALLTTYETRLRAAVSEAARLREALAEAQAAAVDPQELETEAIRGLKETIDWHQRRLAGAEAKLHEAEITMRDYQMQLDEERRQADALEAALVERDRYLAALQAGLPPRHDPR